MNSEHTEQHDGAPGMVEQPWVLSTDDLVDQIDVEPDKGFSIREIEQRRRRFGSNRLRRYVQKGAWAVLVEQFANIIIGLLIVAAIVSFVFGHNTEGIAILVVIIINAGIGFWMEIQAIRSMESLRELGTATVKVRRDGTISEVPADELVPGDIVILEGGDVVTADMRILEASRVQANESALTGESMPVDKHTEALPEETILADRENMLFKGTALTRGSAEAIVISTGMNTELGHISKLVEEAEEEQTPLEKRLAVLGHKLVWVTLIIAAFIGVSGYFSGRELLLVIETAIALAVATVPEGLPVVATIALARGMWRMAERNALVKHLSAVETLGSTNIICTDKTGTLTENELTVSAIRIPGQQWSFDGEQFSIQSQEVSEEQEGLERILRSSVLCSNASLGTDGKGVGDPLEVALLTAGKAYGFEQKELKKSYPEKLEDAFDPSTKRMAVVNEHNSDYLVSVKGAPETIIDLCTRLGNTKEEGAFSEEEKRAWLSYNEDMAEDGLRVIALAGKSTEHFEDETYEDLILYGLVGMYDPPRKEVRKSVDACQAAGVRVVMVTGDHPITARKIGLATGQIDDPNAEILEGKDLKDPEETSEKDHKKVLRTPIFARVSPEQKLNLIGYYQKDGSIVAMTGDGVNDAPALKKSDIGVAMGQRGTQVAREAADIVLLDDAFSTIVAAIREGRIIFNNIRKFVLYLLSCNVSEIMVIGGASIFTFFPLPILPLQILFLNLVTDVFPALALGVGEGSNTVLDKPPRDPKESILVRKHWLAITGYGLLITVVVMVALYVAMFQWELERGQAVTISFLTLAFAQLWHVFNMRGVDSSLIRNEVTRNPWVWGALALCIGLLIASVYLPGISDVLQLTDPGYSGWALVISMSLIPALIGQVFKMIVYGLGIGAPDKSLGSDDTG